MSSYNPIKVEEIYNYKHTILSVMCGVGFFVVITKNQYNALTWGHKSKYIRNILFE